MDLLKWFRKKNTVIIPAPPAAESPPVSDVTTQPPRLTFEIQEGQNVLIACSWPRPASNQEANDIVQAYAMLVYLAISGKLLPGIQYAISNFNNTDRLTQEMAKSILTALHQIMENKGIVSMPFEEDEPAIDPEEVFNYKGDNPG